MPLFSGKTWFRNNITPYLTKIKSEIASNSCCYPPIITAIDPIVFPISVTTTVGLKGEFFTPTMVITCPTATISNYTFINQQECTFDIITSTAQVNTITATTAGGSDTITIESVLSLWIDLRLGSTSTFTEEHKAGTTVTRYSDGMGSNGSLWSNWIRFPSDQWNRSTLKQCSIIMKKSAANMAGIMSTEEQDENSSAQYYQAEIYAYMPSTYMWGFYGTNSANTGISGNQSNVTISTPYYKIQFNDNGQSGSTFRIFGLADLTNFDDESDLLGTWTVPASFTANDNPIMPCVTMSGATRIVAYKVKDM